MADRGEKLKQTFKKLGKIFVHKYKIISIIILVVFLVILVGSIYILTLDEGSYKEEDISNTPYAASTYINGVTITENGLETEITAEELWNEMIENDSNIKNYLKSAEELEKLMNVEIVTQYPKMGKGELDGIVEFKRKDTNSNVKNLKYVDEETFNSYIEQYNSNGDTKAENYYTIDSEGNLLMSEWTKITTKVTTTQGDSSNTTTSVEYTMSATQINYKSALQKYTMPFNYLWAILITTKGHDFVLDLADYVLEDSQIEITGTENYASSTDTRSESTEVEVQVQKEVVDPETGEKTIKTETETQTRTTTTETTVEANNVIVDLTKADTWIVDYEKDSDGKEKLTPKDDPNSEDRNFVTILNEYTDTKKDIVIYADWLFEVLEQNDDTADMVDLTKYLIYKATGKDLGVTDFDFSAYSDNDFNTVSTSGSEQLIRFIHYFEHGSPPPTNADGTKYIIETDGKGHPTVGYGVDIYNSGYLSLFKSAGYPTNVGGEVDKDFVDSIEAQILEDKASEVKAKTSGLNLTGYQLNALISRAYNCGTAGATGTRNGKTFVQAYNAYWDEDKDDYFKDKKKNANFSHSLYTTYMNVPVTSDGSYMAGLEKRRKSEWTLFQTGYYDVLGEWYSDANGDSIVETAKNIHQYMEKNHYTYCVYFYNSYEECSNSRLCGLNKTFEQSKTGYKHCCCATFVSWVLQETGYLKDTEHQDSANNLQTLLKGKGFKVINKQSDLQPGDILCYDHHVEIYAGNNTIYNAGSGNAIRSSSPQKRTRSFNYALRAPN